MTPLKAAIARAKEAHHFMLTHAMRNQYLHFEVHSGHWAYDDYPTGIRVCLNTNGGYSHKERAYGC